MHKLTLGLLVVAVLVGCASQPEPVAGYRRADAPIWSIAQLETGRLTGNWTQVGDFSGPSCGASGVSISGNPGGLMLAGEMCRSGRRVQLASPLEPAGPGRFRVEGQEWWVLWVDTDYRTLVVGSPSGRLGFVLNRGGALPADRLRAVREMFDFNGYRAERLHVFAAGARRVLAD